MQTLIATYSPLIVAAAFLVMLFAGFTKGAVGFALPMIAISGIGSLMSAEVAIGALILPALVTNAVQSVRNGMGPAWVSLIKFWRLNAILFVMIAVCAQLVVLIPDAALFIILGGMVTIFGTTQLIGWQPGFNPARRNLVEVCVGLVAGFFGGLSGVWGPPILMYLLAMETPKVELVRVQGISFLVGSIVLLGAHLRSGVLDAVTLPFSAWLLIPAVVGMVLGQRLQDRLDQQKFRKLTLIVLVLAGLNLLRRGIMG